MSEGDDDVDMDSEDGDDMDEDDKEEDDSDDEDDEDSDDEDLEDDDKVADEDIGFDWDGHKNAKDEEDEEDAADEGPKSKLQVQARTSKGEGAAKELELHRKEQALRDKAGCLHRDQDFEKLDHVLPEVLIRSLRYMAFQMSVAHTTRRGRLRSALSRPSRRTRTSA